MVAELEDSPGAGGGAAAEPSFVGAASGSAGKAVEADDSRGVVSLSTAVSGHAEEAAGTEELDCSLSNVQLCSILSFPERESCRVWRSKYR